VVFCEKAKPPALNSLGVEAPRVAFAVFSIVKSKLFLPNVLLKSTFQSPIFHLIPVENDLSTTVDAICGKNPFSRAAVVPLPSV